MSLDQYHLDHIGKIKIYFKLCNGRRGGRRENYLKSELSWKQGKNMLKPAMADGWQIYTSGERLETVVSN